MPAWRGPEARHAGMPPPWPRRGLAASHRRGGAATPQWLLRPRQEPRHSHPHPAMAARPHPPWACPWGVGAGAGPVGVVGRAATTTVGAAWPGQPGVPAPRVAALSSGGLTACQPPAAGWLGMAVGRCCTYPAGCQPAGYGCTPLPRHAATLPRCQHRGRVACVPHHARCEAVAVARWRWPPRPRYWPHRRGRSSRPHGRRYARPGWRAAGCVGCRPPGPAAVR